MFAAALLVVLLAPPPGERVDFGTRPSQRVRLLRHDNPGVRRKAALLLAHAPADEAIAGLLVALGDLSPGVREAVAATLGELGDERAVPFLSRLCRRERAPRVLATALVALGRCGGAYVARHVQPFLEHPSRQVRVAACSALGHIGDAGQRDALWSALRYAPDDPDFSVRAAILSAFVNLGWNDDARRAIAELRKMGAHRHWLSRAAILAAIGAARLEDQAPHVRRELAAADDPRVVAAAAGALARLGQADEVFGLLDHEAPTVRRAALVALQEVGDPRAVDRAARLVREDPDLATRFEAALVLAHADHPDADVYLVDALKSRHPLFWITALATLEQRHGQSFGRDPEAWTRFFAAKDAG